MTKTIDEHLQEVKQKRGRITDLKQSILGNEKKLSELEAKYKEAVINDSSNIDDLYYEIESLQAKLKADKHKLTTLQAVTEEHLRKSAYEVLLTFPAMGNAFSNDIKNLREAFKIEVERHENAMRELKSKSIDINDQYEDEAIRYLGLTEQHGIVGSIKNSYGISTPSVSEKLKTEREKARAEYKLLPPRLYDRIEAAAEGRSKLFTLKEVK